MPAFKPVLLLQWRTLLKLTISCFIVCCSSCSKEALKPKVSLDINYLQKKKQIEWQHLEGTWAANEGTINIDATGEDETLFKLHLPQVNTTGNYDALNIQNIYFKDAADFNPDSLQGTLTITKRDTKEVWGTFNLKFNMKNEMNAVRWIEGKFKVIL